MARSERSAAATGDEGRLPDFFVVGAHKAGTTAVARFLDRHPEVFVSPVKEPRHFALAGESREYTGPDDPASRFEYEREEEYRRLFSGAEDAVAVGEASTLYLYHPAAAEKIARRIPDARIIAILRHPVDRAYSNFLHCRRDGQEPEADFVSALNQERSRIGRGWGPLWHYQAKGRYATQLARYFERFPRERVLVVTYDELERDSVGLLRRIHRFLGADDRFVPETGERWNPGGVPLSVTLQRTLVLPNPLRSAVAALLPAGVKRTVKRLIQSANLRPAPPLPRELRAALTRNLYGEEIVAAEEMTGLSLAAEWLSDETVGSEVEARAAEVPLLGGSEPAEPSLPRHPARGRSIPIDGRRR